MNNWRTAFRIAWREARAARGKFLFVVLAVAAGVACITGVRGFSYAFRTMLLREARTLMAADLLVRTFDWPTDTQWQAMAALEARGVTRTWITETVSMISAEGAQDPLLVSVKAVDPAVYPFYGQVRLRPAGLLRETLTPDSVAVSEDLLMRLGLSIGDKVKLGQGESRIAAVVTLEPDRMTGSLNVGPRLMISRAGIERAGLMVQGSRISHRFLFRLSPAGVDIREARLALMRVFPRTLISDFRETHPQITRGLNRATTFLSLVSLISLIVGALGVATAMHSHLQQRMDSIAVMKCLGARSSQISRIYVVQTFILGVAGSVAGIVLGLAVQSIFPFLLARYFPIRPDLYLDAASAMHGLGAGLLTTLLFTWPPLAAIRGVRPNLIFRRDMPEAGLSWSERTRKYGRAAFGALFICAGLIALATWVAGGMTEQAIRMGGWFAASLAVSLVLLAAFGKLLLSGLRIALTRLPRKPPPSVRHGLANLYRPGNQGAFVLAAMALGVMFTLTVFLLQRSMISEMFRSAPRGMPNVFLINVTQRERAGLLDLLHKQPGLESQPWLVAAIPARLDAVNGIPPPRDRGNRGSRYSQTRVSWAAEKPEQTEILRGAWWNPRTVKQPQVSISEDVAANLAIEPGARLDFTSYGRKLSAEVTSVHRTDPGRPSLEFVFSPGVLDGLPANYFGGLRVRPKDVPYLQREAWKRYPTVTVINAADVLEIIQDVVDHIALIVRFVSFFAIFAGMVVLASSVAGTRFRRIREVAILKSLGATRRRIAGIFSIEFLVLGAVAGLMGSILASAFSSLVLKRFFDTTFRFDAVPNLLGIVTTAILATIAGWVAGYRLLREKPLAVLRHE